MPIIVVITLVNFICMYWIDKFLLLRFYRKPKNWGTGPINYTLLLLKFSFVFHFYFGTLALSNTDIFKSDKDGMHFKHEIEAANEWLDKNISGNF